MCATVARTHVRAAFASSHRVVPLAEAPPRGALREAAVCSEHGEPLKLFDATCARLVCQICTVLQHKPHEFQPLEAAAARARGDVDAVLGAAETHAARLHRGAAAAATTRTELDPAKRSAEKEIHTTFEQVRLPRWSPTRVLKRPNVV